MKLKHEEKQSTLISAEELEKEAAKESNEILDKFRQRANDENARLLDATDSEFWVAMCFQTREQKEEFLRKAHLIQYGDKYLDGMKVAEEMGIKLETEVPPVRKISKFGGGYLKRIIK